MGTLGDVESFNNGVEMRIFSHTCSNTEIVCALGCAHLLVGVDLDSDYPPDVVNRLPRAGRDLSLDIDQVLALRPDLVLTSLTVPGHEKIVARLRATGIAIIVCDPISLDDVFSDIRRIAAALNVGSKGDQLVAHMQQAMPYFTPHHRPNILVEWWPKPLICPGKHSWVTDMIHRAGGVNPLGNLLVKSQPMTHAAAAALNADVVVISWCGVKVEKYRKSVVIDREGWQCVPAVVDNRIAAISEAFLGRPGPRLIEGYRRLRQLVESIDEGRL